MYEYYQYWGPEFNIMSGSAQNFNVDRLSLFLGFYAWEVNEKLEH